MVRNSQNAKSPRLTLSRYDVNVSKQTTLLDGVDIGTPRWRVSMGGLIDRVHEAMNPSLITGAGPVIHYAIHDIRDVTYSLFYLLDNLIDKVGYYTL